MCCRLQVTPSGESYEGKRRPGRKQRQTTAGIWRDHFTSPAGDCPYTGISSGPNAMYGKTLPLLSPSVFLVIAEGFLETITVCSCYAFVVTQTTIVYVAAEYCAQRVCLYDSHTYLRNHTSTNFTVFLRMLPMAVARSSSGSVVM